MTARSRTRELPDHVVVGRVRKPHGVRGEVAVEAHSDVSGRFEPGSRLVAKTRASGSRPVVVASIRRHGDVHLVRFEECEDRETAELFRSAVLEVARSEVPPPPRGAYYYYELVGCRCVDREGGDLGRVVDLVEDGGGLLLELASPEGSLLIPFVAAYLTSVDVEGGLIELDLPEGLVETCTSTS